MKRIIGAVILAVGLTGAAGAAERTNREWLKWSSEERAAYFMGVADATYDWVGLICPNNANYALGVLYTQEAAEKDPNGSIMESVGRALHRAGCTTGDMPKPAAKPRQTF